MNEAADPALDEFREAVSGPDEDIDLARVGLIVARVQYPALEIEPVLESLNALAARVRARVSPEAPTLDQVEALSSVMIEDFGLRGATRYYYDPRNSFLNEVMERKVGIPVSLSILYMSVGARAGIPLAGAAIPRHFLIRILGVQPARFIDVYGKGRIMDLETCKLAVSRMFRGQVELHPEMFETVSNAAVVTRLLTNLKVIYFNSMRYSAVVPILDRMILVNPMETTLWKERGLVRFRLGHSRQARRDLEHYLSKSPSPEDEHEIRELLRRIG